MTNDDPQTIECRVGSWYFKRMTLMAAMLAVFAAWFLYDGTVGYARKNRAALAEEAFAAGGAGVAWAKFEAESPHYRDMGPSTEVAASVKAAHAAGAETVPWSDFARKNELTSDPSAGTPEARVKDAFQAGKAPGAVWEDFAVAGGLAVDPSDAQEIALKRAFEAAGQKREFAGYAASLGFDSKDNKYHTRKDIVEQRVIAGLCAAGALFALLMLALNRNRVLRADAEAMILPGGARMPFASAYRIDKRKWDNKGLAYVHYRENGAERKAVIDDLKFVGAGKILDRLLAGFQGELVERAVDSEDEESAPAPAGSDPSGKEQKS